MTLPQSFLDSLEKAKGFDRVAFEAAHTTGEQVTSIRLNPFKKENNASLPEGVQVPWCLQGLYLEERPSFTFDPAFHAGAYYVQEASSMFIWYVLEQLIGGKTAGKKVLDLCAAPGGKSTLLSTYFKDGLLVANEVIKTRAAVLVENITKWGTTPVVVTNNDPVHFQSLPAYFDVMMVDAPCSGSGLFRKDPSAIAEWSEDNVQLCSQRQQRILADVLPALKQDGLLLYSTCSYSVEEDEAIADWLVDEMGMESVQLQLPAAWAIVETNSPRHQAKGYRFYPDKIKGEGFFISVFRQKKGIVGAGKKQKEPSLPQPSRQEMQMLQAFMPNLTDVVFFKQADAIRCISEPWWQDLKLLAGQLYIKKAGTELGSIKGRDIVPSHELALSLLPIDHFPAIDLPREEALQYLRRKEFRVDAKHGWNIIRYDHLPLGWVKILPNRINNYYPAAWRILKD
ncbi:16S rRNA C967 or C1407 C5-methylase, RsmB/RsmF family [Hydrobacter penzbergensis]|uniref:16S rRNA C967 or C1407 C5-methylase, RsmB/RsmF family n=1 Tax=Hydrobacter penzbergensis TaxID=1235997 RepID=A0A8X8IDB5_9BACT|nr:RNA methyltransferase [Hydrobacter penzbergensis]SDW25581.1 16S rRNA C967 or C1407 C5-methylase, RsmB/RsmF family [Hydrobacter penzbergensis]